MRDIQKQLHDTAVDHGWWENPPRFPEVIALIHSEASEALEEYRNGHPLDEVYFGDGEKPEGVPVELADIVIRVLDFCEFAGIDLESIIDLKNDYNKTRPYRHGGKVV